MFLYKLASKSGHSRRFYVKTITLTFAVLETQIQILRESRKNPIFPMKMVILSLWKLLQKNTIIPEETVFCRWQQSRSWRTHIFLWKMWNPCKFVSDKNSVKTRDFVAVNQCRLWRSPWRFYLWGFHEKLLVRKHWIVDVFSLRMEWNRSFKLFHSLRNRVFRFFRREK